MFFPIVHEPVAAPENLKSIAAKELADHLRIVNGFGNIFLKLEFPILKHRGL